MLPRLLTTSVALYHLLPLPRTCMACTNQAFVASDTAKTTVLSRTMEFDLPDNYFMDWELVSVPQMSDTVWKNKYGYVKVSSRPLPGIKNPWKFNVDTEGMNEKGLSVSAQVFDEAVYQKRNSAPGAKNVEYWQVPSYILGNFANVQEVVDGLQQVTVVATLDKYMINMHWAVHDAAPSKAYNGAPGNGIVIEYVNGQLVISNNTVGVMTNDPAFSWHLTHLNYFGAVNNIWYPTADDGIAVDTDIGPVPVWPDNYGSNLLGLPADYSPPSRFVRQFFLKQLSLRLSPPKSYRDALGLMTQLVNSVAIPRGAIGPIKKGQQLLDYTQWAVLKVPRTKLFAVRNSQDNTWNYVDLDEIPLQAGATPKSKVVSPKVSSADPLAGMNSWDQDFS